MGHETFLIATYFAASAICAAIGWWTWKLLRPSIVAVAAMLPTNRLKIILERAFPASAILVALSAFMSVDYYACGAKTYAQIVADRAWMLECNQQQFARAFERLAGVVCIWVLIVSVALIATRRGREG